MFVDFVPIPDLFSPRENKSWLGKKSELYELLIDRVWECSPVTVHVVLCPCAGSSPTVLCGTFPHKHSNVRLHIIVWHIRTGIFDICSMGVITSIFGIDAICSRTIGVSYTVRSFFVIVAIYSMFMISSWRYRYIMLVTWQFPDSFLCRPAPAINSNVWLHYIVTLAVSCIRNSKCMSMTACRTSFSIGKVIFCIVVSWMPVNRT